jgi:hypothetical protein
MGLSCRTFRPLDGGGRSDVSKSVLEIDIGPIMCRRPGHMKGRRPRAMDG